MIYNYVCLKELHIVTPCRILPACQNRNTRASFADLGSWDHNVVRMSVCPVTLCIVPIVASRVDVDGTKLYQIV